MTSRTTGWVLLTLGLAAVVGVVTWVVRYKADPKPPQGMPPFMIKATFAQVERGDLPLEATLTGRVATLRRARVGFDLGGRIAALSVREGDRVKEGAELAHLDPAERKAILAVAQAAEARAREELTLLKAPPRREEAARLVAQVEAAEADLRWTTGEEARLAPLVQSGGVTRSTHESMVAQKRSAQARLEAARAALDLLRAGARAEEIAVQAARVEEAVAAVARAQTDVDRTVLRAPFAGQVVRRLLAPGDAVSPGVAVLELVDLGAREIVLEIPARHTQRLDPKGRVTLSLDERPAFSLEAALSAVVLDTDPTSGAQRALVRLEPEQDAEGVLTPGAFVRARLHLAPVKDALLVPADAIRRTVEGWTVVTANEELPAMAPPPGAPPDMKMPPLYKAAFVSVRLVAEHAGRAAVEPLEGGLVAGDRIVVVGVDLAAPSLPLVAGAVVPAAAPGTPPPAGPPPANGAAEARKVPGQPEGAAK
jgi:HlyD family secretion protein